MNLSGTEMKELIEQIATSLEKDRAPELDLYGPFLKNPQIALSLVDYIEHLEENADSENYPLYSAAIFALDVSIS